MLPMLPIKLPNCENRIFIARKKVVAMMILADGSGSSNSNSYIV